MGIVYCAVNRNNGKRYIGQTRHSLEYRKAQHRSEACVKGTQRPFYNAIRKYGIDAFDWVVLHDGLIDDDELDIYEKAAIRTQGTICPAGYNLTDGGSNGRPSDETKAKIREARARQVITPETRAKMSAALKGIKWSEQALANRRAGMIGVKRSPEACRNIKLGCAKRPPQTEEANKRRRLAQIGRSKNLVCSVCGVGGHNKRTCEKLTAFC